MRTTEVRPHPAAALILELPMPEVYCPGGNYHQLGIAGGMRYNIFDGDPTHLLECGYLLNCFKILLSCAYKYLKLNWSQSEYTEYTYHSRTPESHRRHRDNHHLVFPGAAVHRHVLDRINVIIG